MQLSDDNNLDIQAPARFLVTVLGVGITNVHRVEAVRRMQEFIRSADGRARAIYIVNAHALNLACEIPGYREVLNSGDAVFGDGTGVRWAARLRDVRMVDNLVGTDLIPFFFANTMEERYRYFLLGARREVVSAAAKHITERYPALHVVGYQHGHYAPEEHDAVIQKINGTRPDVLLVAMGNPIQERWIHDNLPRLKARLSIGVGGLFDHWAGALRRAPYWVRRNGFEWVQLMFQQPHKWRRYLIGNPKFLLRSTLEAARHCSPLM